MAQTLDHVVVVHILILDKRKSQINEYSDYSNLSIWIWFGELIYVCECCSYCESTADEYTTPGNLKGLDGHGLHHQGHHGVGAAGVAGAGAGGLLHRSNTSSSSSSSDDEDIDDVNRTGVDHVNPDGTTFVNTAPKKKSLFKKLLHHWARLFILWRKCHLLADYIPICREDVNYVHKLISFS